MKTRLLILAAVLSLLIVVFFVYRAGEEKRLSAVNLREFFWADSNLIDSMAIKYGDWSHLFRRAGRWYMVVDSTFSYPAIYTDVAAVIQTTNEMVLTDLISSNPEKRAKFNVDTTQGTWIKFFNQGMPLSNFVLGRIGQDFLHTYVQDFGSDSVWLAKGRFARIYSKAPPLWLDRQVFSFPPDDLVEIRWRYHDQETRLSRGDSGEYWIARDPGFVPVPADSTEAAFKFNYISNLSYNSFLPAGREHEARFDDPMLTLTAVDRAGATREVLVVQDTTVPNPRYFSIRPEQPRPVGILFKSDYDRLKGRFEELQAAKQDEQ